MGAFKVLGLSQVPAGAVPARDVLECLQA